MKTTSALYAQSVIYYLRHIAQIAPKAIYSIEQRYSLTKQQRITIDNYAALLREGAKATQDTLFGFSLGQHIQTTDYGVLGYLIESCENLQQAVTSLLAFDSLVAELGNAQFETDGDTAKILWFPFQTLEKQVILRNMTAWVTTTRKLLNSALTANQVSFTFALCKKEQLALEQWFNCPVVSNHKLNCISFPSEFLTLPFRSNDQSLFQALTLESKKQLVQFSTHKNNLKQQVESLLSAKPNLIQCDQPRVASALNMSVRTMQRNLKQDNVTFMTLLNNERKKRVKSLIIQHNLIQVTSLLGYIEQATLSKAFKTWFGITPSQFKASVKQVPEDEF